MCYDDHLASTMKIEEKRRKISDESVLFKKYVLENGDGSVKKVESFGNLIFLWIFVP